MLKIIKYLISQVVLPAQDKKNIKIPSPGYRSPVVYEESDIPIYSQTFAGKFIKTKLKAAIVKPANSQKKPRAILLRVPGNSESLQESIRDLNLYVSEITNNDEDHVVCATLNPPNVAGSGGIPFEKQDLFDGLNAVFKALTNLYPDVPVIIDAHSLGGSYALEWAAQLKQEDADKISMLFAGRTFSHISRVVAGQSALTKPLNRLMQAFGWNLNPGEVIESVKKKGINVVCVNAFGDKVIPKEAQLLPFLEQQEGKEYKDHYFVEKFEDMVFKNAITKIAKLQQKIKDKEAFNNEDKKELENLGLQKKQLLSILPDCTNSGWSDELTKIKELVESKCPGNYKYDANVTDDTDIENVVATVLKAFYEGEIIDEIINKKTTVAKEHLKTAKERQSFAKASGELKAIQKAQEEIDKAQQEMQEAKQFREKAKKLSDCVWHYFVNTSDAHNVRFENLYNRKGESLDKIFKAKALESIKKFEEKNANVATQKRANSKLTEEEFLQSIKSHGNKINHFLDESNVVGVIYALLSLHTFLDNHSDSYLTDYEKGIKELNLIHSNPLLLAQLNTWCATDVAGSPVEQELKSRLIDIIKTFEDTLIVASKKQQGVDLKLSFPNDTLGSLAEYIATQVPFGEFSKEVEQVFPKPFYRNEFKKKLYQYELENAPTVFLKQTELLQEPVRQALLHKDCLNNSAKKDASNQALNKHLTAEQAKNIFINAKVNRQVPNVEPEVAYYFLQHIKEIILTTEWPPSVRGSNNYRDENNKPFMRREKMDWMLEKINEGEKRTKNNKENKAWIDIFAAVTKKGKEAANNKPFTLFGIGARDEKVQSFYELVGKGADCKYSKKR